MNSVAYVVPISHQRGFKNPNGPFPSKSALLSMKVCYKVSLCENCQRRKEFIGLSIQKWLVGDVSIYVKIWPKLTHPIQKTPTSNQYSLVAPPP